MQRKKKIVSKVVCSLFAVLSLSSFGMMYASASFIPSEFKAVFTFNYRDYFTENREKEDDSYMWIRVDSGPYGSTVSARAYGQNVKKPGGNVLNGRVDCSKGYSTGAIKIGERDVVTNWVYEMGYDYGSLRITNNKPTPETFTGYWSPDNP